MVSRLRVRRYIEKHAFAFEKEGLAPKDVVVVTGIGCWGKADDYLYTNTVHVTHGRALPVATGIKVANPSLKVVALMVTAIALRSEEIT